MKTSAPTRPVASTASPRLRDVPLKSAETTPATAGDASEILSAVRDLAPAIRARRQEIEQARCIPSDLAKELRRTRVFSLGVPRAIGGREAAPRDLLHAIETIAEADGSTGWCAMVGIANNVTAGYMNEAGAREVFGDTNAPSVGIAAAAGTAVRVDGGVRVSGRWSFASGIGDAEWLWAGCVVTENGQPRMTPHGPEMIHVCMPVAEVTIHDTWRVSGLCGTGSNDFTAKDVFVPDRRIFALLDPAGHRREPLYRMPPLTLFVFQVVAVSLGVARSALDEITELAATKTPTLYAQPLADRPMAQIEIARAEASLGGARAFLHAIVEEMWQAISAGGNASNRQLALARIATTQAVEAAAAVTRTANTLAGGNSIYSSSSLQRHARDTEAILHHFTVSPHVWEEAGRVLLGRQPNVPAF